MTHKTIAILLTLLILTIPTITTAPLQATNTTTTTATNYTDINQTFQQISKTPYDVNNYNCLHKSFDFIRVLLKYNETNLYIIRITYKTGEYGHAFVRWDGRAYDPTSTPPQYNKSYDEYLTVLRNVGFTGEITEQRIN